MTTLERDGYEIAYDVAGVEGAPVVVFSHSLGLDSSSWAAQVEVLAGSYRLVTVDTRGHGRSGAPPGPYSVEGLAGDVLAVVDHEGIDRFHYVGLSAGGLMALWSAIAHPARLRSAAFCNTAARLGSEQGWTERIEAVTSLGMEGIGDAVTTRFFSAGFAERHPEDFAGARAKLVATDPAGYLGVCAALRDADLRDRVRGIEVPVLIIGADQDVSTPPPDAQWLHERVAGSELTIIEGAGHVSNLDAPDAFMAALRPHLDRH
jgi:3-oxoadipate enol-lactonase